MLIKNNSARPYTVQGITLIPGQETEIPEGKQADVVRDIESITDLEEVKGRRKAAKETVDANDPKGQDNTKP